MLTIEQHLLGGMRSTDELPFAASWNDGVQATARAVHELLAANLVPEGGVSTISYRFGKPLHTVVQLNSYDGRLYFPARIRSRMDLASVQERARAAGMRAGGTWIELPDDSARREALLVLLRALPLT